MATLLYTALTGFLVPAAQRPFAPTPLVHATLRTSAVLLQESSGVPADVTAACMWDPGTYSDAEIEANWNEMVGIYGSEELAKKAVLQVRGTVICPLYTNAAGLRTSYDALVSLMGDESKEILEMHPAILTCGDELRNADKDEVRRLAKVRSIADSIPPEAILGSIALIAGILGYRIVMIKFFGAPMVGADAFPTM